MTLMTGHKSFGHFIQFNDLAQGHIKLSNMIGADQKWKYFYLKILIFSREKKIKIKIKIFISFSKLIECFRIQ